MDPEKFEGLEKDMRMLFDHEEIRVERRGRKKKGEKKKRGRKRKEEAVMDNDSEEEKEDKVEAKGGPEMGKVPSPVSHLIPISF